ncbi:(Fe-S)-binding protein [Thermodesulfobium sp.]
MSTSSENSLSLIEEYYEEQIIRCMKCGMCQSICPVYYEDSLETGCARGKLALSEALLHGKLEPNHKIEMIFNKCLLCHACAQVCPVGLSPDKVFAAARAEMVKRYDMPWIKSLIYRKLLGEGKLSSLTGTLSLANRLKLFVLARSLSIPKIFGKSAIRLSFATLPDIPSKPFLDRFPELLEPNSKPIGTVGYFVGCAQNSVFQDVSEASVNILLALGYRVIIPKDQGCCGFPHYGAGDFETLKQKIIQNSSAFKKYKLDAIIISCATGGSGLKEVYPEMTKEDNLKTLGANVYDISEFLALKHLDDLKKMMPTDKKEKIKITYHDACHLNRLQGISSQPRQLLSIMPSYELVEMENSTKCCGEGGGFTFYYQDISSSIANRKKETIKNTGAKVVVLGCPGCRAQISGALKQEGLDIDTKHTVCLLWDEIKKGKDSNF